MSQKVKLYTFQPLFIWECLKDLGYYHPFFLDDFDTFLQKDKQERVWNFLSSYRWLREEMLKKNIKYDINNSHLIWAWYQWGGSKKPIPDKRYSCVYNYFENPYVMLELEIDSERVLLSDYDAWHWVLSYSYLEKTRKADAFDKAHKHLKKPYLQGIAHETLSSSWHNIFDMKCSRDILGYSKKDQQIQATFFELFYTDIKKVHFFSNKRCTSVISLKN